MPTVKCRRHNVLVLFGRLLERLGKIKSGKLGCLRFPKALSISLKCFKSWSNEVHPLNETLNFLLSHGMMILRNLKNTILFGKQKGQVHGAVSSVCTNIKLVMFLCKIPGPRLQCRGFLFPSSPFLL